MKSVANKTHPFVGGRIAISDTTNTAPPWAGVAYQSELWSLGGSGCKSQGGLGARDSILGKGIIIPQYSGIRQKFCESIRRWP